MTGFDCIVVGSGPGGYVAAIRAAQLGMRRTASLTAEGSVVVDGNELHAERGVVLATGSVRKGIPGIEFGGHVIGTEEAWALTEIPKTMIVVGAGASGVEIASAYARLGSRVTLFEGLDRVLPTEDVDISRVVERSFSKQGIEVRTEARYAGESADKVVIASGRRPDVDELGLAAAGVEVDQEGWLLVDGEMRTSVPGIYAIGDLVRGPALAHKASDEGVIAAEAIAGTAAHSIAHADIPRATFCKPHVASFGLTEAEAVEQGHEVTVGKVKYGTVGGGTVYGDRSGVIKIVGDKRFGELLGGHIVGSNATELIQSLVYAHSLEGGYQEIARLPHGHPTVSEAIMEAARAADGWLIHG